MTRLVLLATLTLVWPEAAAAARGKLAQHPQAREILHDIRTSGAKQTLDALSDEDQWEFVLHRIATGAAEWIDVAEQLHPAADAHAAESLSDAMGEALGANARLVLKRAAGPFFLTDVCDAPDVDDERFDTLAKSLAELNRRIRAVEQVRDPPLTRARRDCIGALQKSEGDLRRFFGAGR